MTRTVGLRPALLVAGVYSLIVGALLLFPTLGATVFAYTVKDAAAGSGWGASIIGMGVVILLATSDVQRYGGLAPAFVLALLIGSFDLLYFFITGAFTARNVIIPLVVNVLLIAWIWSVRPKA